DQVEAESEQSDPVPDVGEHDAEEEREDKREDGSRVDLAVPRQAALKGEAFEEADNTRVHKEGGGGGYILAPWLDRLFGHEVAAHRIRKRFKKVSGNESLEPYRRAVGG